MAIDASVRSSRRPWAGGGRGPADDRQLCGREGPGRRTGGRQAACPAGWQRGDRARPDRWAARRPFAANAPLLGPEDSEDIRFRVFNSPVQADAVRALGATPADLSFSFIDQIKDGTLRGAEFDIAQYEHSGFGTAAGNVTANLVLWPKVFVLALSQQRFDALTAQQQEWVREAAAQAVKASVDATYEETPAARTLCDRGARFLNATPGQLQGLRTKVRPVLDQLAADPTSAQLLRDLQAIAAQHPGPEGPMCRPAAPRASPTTGHSVRFRRRSRPSPMGCTAASSPTRRSPLREATLATTRRGPGRFGSAAGPSR